MGLIHIVTDSASDLSPEQAADYGIVIVPLSIRFGEREYTDREDLSAEEFWKLCKEHSDLPETAAPSPGAFQQAFLAAKAAGADGVVCISLSAALSGTYGSALAAADAVKDEIAVSVVDSCAVTLGEGLMAIAAAEMAKAGATREQIVNAAINSVPRIHVMGILDTLEHLQKGGRVGGAKAMLGSLLSIKPVIELKDGVVAEATRQRTRSRALRFLADQIRQHAPYERFALVNGAATDFDELKASIADVELGCTPIYSELGPVVGTHSGPGLIGFCYESPVGAESPAG